MNNEWEVTLDHSVLSSEDLANIDPTQRRHELERQMGIPATDALLRLLAMLRRHGDVPEVYREIFHLAYFRTMKKTKHFSKWLKKNGYDVFAMWAVRKGRVRLEFSHIEQTTLEAMAKHQVLLRKTTAAYSGDYDGWETSVEHEPLSKAEMDIKFSLRHRGHRGRIGEVSKEQTVQFQRIQNELLSAFNTQLQTYGIPPLPFGTHCNLRRYVHLAATPNQVPTKLVIRHMRLGQSLSIEMLTQIQDVFDEVLSHDRFQNLHDIVVHTR